MKFQVNVRVVALVTIPIEADSKEEAMAQANRLAVVPINDEATASSPPQQSWIRLNIPDNEILVLDAIEERVLDELNRK